MSAVVGIDLSTHALDIVKLSEDSNAATWTRCELVGKTAWERTLAVREAVPRLGDIADYWDDVYLVAIEAPYGRGSRGISTLNRVVGAVVASLPAALLVPERCWLVSPGEWKAGLGLKGKPTWDDLPDNQVIYSVVGIKETHLWQNARDAYCLAYWARETNARAVAQTLEAAT